MPTVEEQLKEATDRILASDHPKKLIVAGPGAGKTTIFKRLLESTGGSQGSRLVLTFINNLKKDLEKDLSDLASVFTLHGYCQSLLHRHGELRGGLTGNFRCLPGLASLIKKDWGFLRAEPSPPFVGLMRELTRGEELDFYMERSDVYDAVDFDDSVYRVHEALENNPEATASYDLVLIDEYQDFNGLESGLIRILAEKSPIVVAGDDDQALYSQLKGASWKFIRSMYRDGEYEIFELPFCMRCPEVIVNAVNDILDSARRLKKLDGRIDKPYFHYAPVKGADSEKYPKIDLVTTTVQRGNANYFGKYIKQEIQKISQAEIDQAKEKDEPLVLVIGSRPYLPQVADYLRSQNYEIEVKDPDPGLERSQAFEILNEDPQSNLGWRIILNFEAEDFAADMVRKSDSLRVQLVDVLPAELKAKVLEETVIWAETVEAPAEDGPEDDQQGFRIKLTSFEGSKGLSAQHVFIIGMHKDEIPRDDQNIQDIEICRFLVGLTRAKKKCSLLHTRKFANTWKQPSPFLSWIKAERFRTVYVDAQYWKTASEAP